MSFCRQTGFYCKHKLEKPQVIQQEAASVCIIEYCWPSQITNNSNIKLHVTMFQLYWIALHLIIERISMVLLKSSEKRKKVFSSKAVKKLPYVFQVNTGLLAGHLGSLPQLLAEKKDQLYLAFWFSLLLLMVFNGVVPKGNVPLTCPSTQMMRTQKSHLYCIHLKFSLFQCVIYLR